MPPSRQLVPRSTVPPYSALVGFVGSGHEWCGGIAKPKHLARARVSLALFTTLFKSNILFCIIFFIYVLFFHTFRLWSPDFAISSPQIRILRIEILPWDTSWRLHTHFNPPSPHRQGKGKGCIMKNNPKKGKGQSKSEKRKGGSVSLLVCDLLGRAESQCFNVFKLLTNFRGPVKVDFSKSWKTSRYAL